MAYLVENILETTSITSFININTLPFKALEVVVDMVEPEVTEAMAEMVEMAATVDAAVPEAMVGMADVVELPTALKEQQ